MGKSQLTRTTYCVTLCVEEMIMATNLQIDDTLITRAVKLGHHRTKKAAVTQALTDYIHYHEQENILSMFGSVDYEPEYNYKKQRVRA
jgi:Arc/MetJ family transcription regulator